jgi:oligopeptide/dipeptide ABC transporter ATP-binding protein
VPSDVGGRPREQGEALLKVENLVKHFPITQGIVFRKTIGAVRAVDGVSFELRRGETLGLVGESGCGKSTVAKTLLRLETPTDGKAWYKGEDIFSMSPERLRRLRREMQIIFQDPYTSLNPRMTVGDIISEPWEIHTGIVPRDQRRRRVGELLERVGLDPDHVNRYPHQFSGGQRQRIGIARGLALNPDVIICDEPVSALDVSVQAQVINLLEEIQDDFGLAYIFVAHDLSVVRHISDRVAVMYLGRIVEVGTETDIYERPTHPYTQALLSAVPIPDPAARGRGGRIVLEGDVPSPANPPSGCRFRTRCWKAEDVCAKEDPALTDRFGHGHPSACHFADVREVVG